MLALRTSCWRLPYSGKPNLPGFLGSCLEMYSNFPCPNFVPTTHCNNNFWQYFPAPNWFWAGRCPVQSLAYNLGCPVVGSPALGLKCTQWCLLRNDTWISQPPLEIVIAWDKVHCARKLVTKEIHSEFQRQNSFWKSESNDHAGMSENLNNIFICYHAPLMIHLLIWKLENCNSL